MTIISGTPATTAVTAGVYDAYATLSEIKSAAPETFGSSTTYDKAICQLAERASRLIDMLTRRTFYATTATRYFPGTGSARLFIPDLLAITSVNISSDYGTTWAEVVSGDYLALGGRDLDDAITPYMAIELHPTGSYLEWYKGPRACKVVGVWGYHADYANAWEDSQDTIENTGGILANATSITVNDADGVDLRGYTPRFAYGQWLLIESEQFACVGMNAQTNALTVVAARHGTAAAAHAKDKAIYIWQPDPVVKQATIAQALRWFKRGQQSFQDTGGIAELGTLTYTKKLDPEIESMLLDSGLRRSRA